MPGTLYYAFTLNNYTETQENYLKQFAAEYCDRLMYGREEAPTTGTKHLQGCFQLKIRRLRDPTKNILIRMDPSFREMHLEPQKKVYLANANYCEKSENCYFYPSKEANFSKEGKVVTKKNAKYEEALKLAREGNFEEISAEMLIKHEPRLIKQYVEHQKVENMMLDNQHGNFFQDFFILIHGETGVGKSFSVSTFLYCLNEFWKWYCNVMKLTYQPIEAYLKKCNKWWDGYRGQKAVVIEEVEPNWFRLSGNMLKQLLDQYPFPVECKGATINKIRPQWVIMTSNYSLKQLCSKEDGTLIAENYYPLKRRVFEYNMRSRSEFINWPNLSHLKKYFDTHEEVVRNRNYYLNLKYNRLLTEAEKDNDFIGQSEPDSMSVEASTSEQVEPQSEITDEEPINEPILLDTVEAEEESSGSESEEVATEVEEEEEEYNWVDAAKEENKQLTKTDWPMCKICGKNETYNSYEDRCEECINKGLVVKDTNYFEELVESAYKVQQFNKQVAKHNKQVYQTNYVEFHWDKPTDMAMVNYYRNIIRGFNQNAFRARRRITKYQREIARMEEKKLNLDEGYKFIDGMNIGEGEVFNSYKDKADCLSDLMLSMSNCSEMIEQYYKEIEQEMQNIMFNYHQMFRFKAKLENFIVNKNKELKQIVAEITEVYFGDN